MLRAADAIAAFITDRSWEQYEDSLLLRSAVERQFEILGEAMKRALGIEPALGARLTDARGVVDFRSRSHGKSETNGNAGVAVARQAPEEAS